MSNGQVIQAVKGWVGKGEGSIYREDDWWEVNAAADKHDEPYWGKKYWPPRPVAVVVLDWSLWERVRDKLKGADTC